MIQRIIKILSRWRGKKTNPNKPNQTQFPKGQNECKLIYNKGLQNKRGFFSPNKQTQFRERPKINLNAFLSKDYENEPPSGPKKQTQTNPISKYYPKATGRKKGLCEAAEKAILFFYVAKPANPALYSENTDT